MSNSVPVRISAASARLQFTPCGPACIAAGCRGNCCDAPTRPTGCLVTIHDSEREKIKARGGFVVNGLLQPKQLGERGCPFKADGLCKLHGTPDKPFGCIASPFTLNRNGTLIIRNRYKMLPCYRGNGPKQPAYRSFRSSLDLIFGEATAFEIVDHFDRGGPDIIMPMPRRNFEILTENDLIKKGAA